MPYVKMFARGVEDERTELVLVGFQDEMGIFTGSREGFGYAIDWCEDTKNYVRYPFFIYRESDVLCWGAFDDTQTSFNFLGRRVVDEETLVRSEGNESWSYKVQGVGLIN